MYRRTTDALSPPQAIVYTKHADGGYDVTISGAPGQRALTYSFKKKQ